MALIDCKECGAKISDKAVACPKCGNPNIVIGVGELTNIVNKGNESQSELNTEVTKNDSSGTDDIVLFNRKVSLVVINALLTLAITGLIYMIIITPDSRGSIDELYTQMGGIILSAACGIAVGAVALKKNTNKKNAHIALMVLGACIIILCIYQMNIRSEYRNAVDEFERSANELLSAELNLEEHGLKSGIADYGTVDALMAFEASITNYYAACDKLARYPAKTIAEADYSKYKLKYVDERIAAISNVINYYSSKYMY